MGASRITGSLFGLVVVSEDDEALTSGVSGRGGSSEEVCPKWGDCLSAISRARSTTNCTWGLKRGGVDARGCIHWSGGWTLWASMSLRLGPNFSLPVVEIFTSWKIPFALWMGSLFPGTGSASAENTKSRPRYL